MTPSIRTANRSVEDDAFITNPMLVGVADQMASKYSEDLGKAVARGLKARARDGKPPSIPGFGYRLVGQGDAMTWEPDERERSALVRIFEEVADGRTYGEVAKRLNAEGITARKGKWSPKQISHLIASRSPLGEFRRVEHVEDCKGHLPPNPGRKRPRACECERVWVKPEGERAIEPIVAEDLWQRAQAVSVERNAKYAKSGRAGRLPKHHLFVRGALRCGLCGEPMIPRSQDGREWYACRTHFELGGADACPMRNQKRADVDVPALRLFQNWVLDVQATRDAYAEQISAQVALARQEAERALTEAQTARSILARVERDYEAGELGPVGYERQLAKQTEAITAAEAEHGRLTKHADKVAAKVGEVDPESEVFHRLAELREQVAGDVDDGEGDVAAVRAALAAVFEGVYVVPTSTLYRREDDAHDELHVRLDGPGDDAALVLEATPEGLREVQQNALALVPVVRKSMLADPDTLTFPEPVRPRALSLSAETTGTAPRR